MKDQKIMQIDQKRLNCPCLNYQMLQKVVQFEQNCYKNLFSMYNNDLNINKKDSEFKQNYNLFLQKIFLKNK